MSFGLCWIVIDPLIEWTGFIKNKQPAARHGFGSTHQAAASRHPEPRKSVNMKSALSIEKLPKYASMSEVMLTDVCSVIMAVSCWNDRQNETENKFVYFLLIPICYPCSEKLHGMQEWRKATRQGGHNNKTWYRWFDSILLYSDAAMRQSAIRSPLYRQGYYWYSEKT